MKNFVCLTISLLEILHANPHKNWVNTELRSDSLLLLVKKLLLNHFFYLLIVVLSISISISIRSPRSVDIDSIAEKEKLLE
jgi:hypothetical protein